MSSNLPVSPHRSIDLHAALADLLGQGAMAIPEVEGFYSNLFTTPIVKGGISHILDQKAPDVFIQVI